MPGVKLPEPDTEEEEDTTPLPAGVSAGQNEGGGGKSPNGRTYHHSRVASVCWFFERVPCGVTQAVVLSQPGGLVGVLLVDLV